MVIPLGGSAGIFGPSCQAVAELAAAELNRASGVLGREVELQVIDASRPAHEVADEVSLLVSQDRLDAVTGWHISSVRNALVPAIDGRLPYVYTSVFEGGENRPGVYCSGEVPNFQILPALAWIAKHLGKKKWFVVGHDYVWPRQTAGVLRDSCARLGINLAGEAYVPMDADQMDHLVEQVAQADCDGVLMLLVGHEAAVFNRIFAERGLHTKMVRFSPLMEENMVMASGPDTTEDLYVSAGFFRTLITAGSFDLQAQYAAFHGAGAPPLNNVAESCYEGMHTLANLTRIARSTQANDMNRVIGTLGYDGPRGPVVFHGNQAVHPVHLARVSGLDFEVIDRL
ncbi:MULTISPECIES: substrate-binding domain-containing protein [unclassified Nesterenkonia]|uniref:substrate-binding domain-containing protein n=1 Tax=unclassified Nesterenkonia TaxID=2629769 RepID=UPI001F4CD6DF|nr:MULTISPECIES: substrate-binding domain-containing protein [unclassified Nesterenkonia]MCH8559239.1 substrate-binding domain-containing protein [Nesterenkonia sp. DZ6]MCH8571584.1 substrate-binding domain-containing protein [Nesterenkonia sp. AY15]